MSLDSDIKTFPATLVANLPTPRQLLWELVLITVTVPIWWAEWKVCDTLWSLK